MLANCDMDWEEKYPKATALSSALQWPMMGKSGHLKSPDDKSKGYLFVVSYYSVGFGGLCPALPYIV